MHELTEIEAAVVESVASTILPIWRQRCFMHASLMLVGDDSNHIQRNVTARPFIDHTGKQR